MITLGLIAYTFGPSMISYGVTQIYYRIFNKFSSEKNETDERKIKYNSYFIGEIVSTISMSSFIITSFITACNLKNKALIFDSLITFIQGMAATISYFSIRNNTYDRLYNDRLSLLEKAQIFNEARDEALAKTAFITGLLATCLNRNTIKFAINTGAKFASGNMNTTLIR
ncbi:MAG: hypothetical protein J0H68_02985 [Sphingobacteriia bacterium]|nr:hypothetical protein [Sphingobacteriia bacterium]